MGVGKKLGSFGTAVEFVSVMLGVVVATRCFYQDIQQYSVCQAYLELKAYSGVVTEKQGWIMCKAVIHEWCNRVVSR